MVSESPPSRLNVVFSGMGNLYLRNEIKTEQEFLALNACLNNVAKRLTRVASACDNGTIDCSAA